MIFASGSYIVSKRFFISFVNISNFMVVILYRIIQSAIYNLSRKEIVNYDVDYFNINTVRNINNVSSSTSHKKTLKLGNYGILAFFFLAHSFMNRFG